MYKFGVFALIVALFSGCNETKKEEVEVHKTKPAKVVKILDIQAQQSNIVLEYPAEIYALQDTTMAFEVSGKIVKFNYKEGQKVPKGAIIAQLDDTIYKATFNSAKANYKQAQIDYERYSKLYKNRSISSADMERTQQNLDVTKSAYEIAKKNLAETKLIAEFDGILAKKIVNDFERVTAKQPILLLQDTSYYKVKFFAPEHDVLKIHGELSAKNISKQADFTVTIGVNADKKTFKAKFADITTTAVTVTRTFETTLIMKKQKDINILPGMTAKVNVISKESLQTNFLIPAQAVFSSQKGKVFVWSVDKDMRVHKKALIVGSMQENHIEVFSGLKDVEKIVISGVRFLKENDKVAQYQKIGE